MVYLFKGCGIDHSASMIIKTKEYIQNKLGHSKIKVVNISDRLDILSYSNCESIECIIIPHIQLYHRALQKSLIHIIKDLSKTKDIILLKDSLDADDVNENPFIKLVDETIEIDKNLIV